MEPKLLFLLLTITALDVCLGQAVVRSSWGQFCNETIKCDKNEWLTCKSSSCVCVLETMVFEHSKSKCVASAGERCKFQITDRNLDTGEVFLFSYTECVDNANCTNGYTCSCDPGFYETFNGTCSEQKEFDDACLSSSECKSSLFLACISERCQCSNESNHIYSLSNTSSTDELRYCVGKAGKKLEGSTDCVIGTVLKDGVCTCVPEAEFYANENGICEKKKNFTEECKRNEECSYKDHYLTCVDGRCGCDPTTTRKETVTRQIVVPKVEEVEVYRNERKQINGRVKYLTRSSGDWVSGVYLRDNNDYYGRGYMFILVTRNRTEDQTLDQCVGLVDEHCNPDSKCIQNAFCEESALSSWLCTCDRGYSRTSSRLCGIGHGMSCSELNPCSDAFRCTDGVCDCPEVNHQIYARDSESACSGLVSGFCTADDECVSNAVCAKDAETGKKQCRCRDDFVENENGTCERAWGSKCTYENDTKCDSVAGLKCRNELCVCPDTRSYFNATSRRCLKRVGSRCQENYECVVGAKCVKENVKISGRCSCTEDFQLNEDLLCVQRQESGQEMAFELEELANSTTPVTDS